MYSIIYDFHFSNFKKKCIKFYNKVSTSRCDNLEETFQGWEREKKITHEQL